MQDVTGRRWMNAAIWVGILLAAFVWCSDAMLEYLWFNSESRTFFSRLLPLQDQHELINRALYVFALLLGGLVCGTLLRLLAGQARQTAQLAENLRITLDSIGDAVIVTDVEGRIVRMNPVAERMTAWSLEEARGRPLTVVFAIVNALTREPAFNPVGRVLETGEIVGLANHTALLARDGTEYQIADSAAPVRSEDGKTLGVVLVFRDVTQEYALQAAIQERGERLASIVEGAGVGTWEWNVQTGELRINEKWAEIIGYRLEELQPVSFATWERLAHPEDAARCKESLERHFADPAVDYHIECRMRHRNGEWVWIADRGKVKSRTEDGKPQWMFGTHLDITARKLAEVALEKRLVSLSRPLSEETDVAFEELFNLADIQLLQDEIASATGVASIITRTDGTPITRPSNFCRLCNDIIRRSPQGCANCYASDAAIGKLRFDGPTVQPCLSSGLWDAGASITVGGRHVANWLIGQVRDATQSEEKMREYAQAIGVDAEAAVAAFREVPAMSREQFGKVAQSMFTMAKLLSSIAYQNVQQARFITERTQAELALQRQLNFTSALLDAVPIPVFYKDRAAHYLGCNLAFTEVFGKTAADIRGRTVQEVWPEDFARQYALRDAEMLRVPTHQVFAGEIRDKEGRIRQVVTAHNYYLDENRQVAGLIGAFLDVTEMKRVEQELRRNEENLRVTLNSIGDAVIATDIEGRVIRLNPVAQKLTGWNIAEAQGKKLDEVFRIINAETRQTVESPVGKVFATGEIVGLANHTVLIHKDGREFQIADSGAPIRADNGEIIGVVLVFRDVTEEYALQAQLLQSQKLDAIGQLAGGVAHDFNNMLCGIIGAADLLRSATAGNSECDKFLTLILDSAERAADLARKLLSFARRQAPGSSPVDVHRSIRDAAAILANTIDKRVAIELDLQATASLVIGDNAQLQGVFLNLGINAWHAMPEGGRLTIRSRCCTLDDPAAHISGFEMQPGDYLAVEVSDTGCGIPPENLPRIFDPFFTTKEPGKGTGLGLAATYGTLQQHKGAITVTSRVGAGTTFRILLPLTQEALRVPPHLVEPVRGSGRILVVDDEPVMRSTAQQVLTDFGYEITVAEDGEEALEIFRARSADFALVVLDMIMPKMNGRDCFRALRQIRQDIPVIITSGFSNEEDLHELRQAGLAGFIRKPFHYAELSQLVASVLRARTV